jgi:hypothetical protein
MAFVFMLAAAAIIIAAIIVVVILPPVLTFIGSDPPTERLLGIAR